MKNKLLSGAQGLAMAALMQAGPAQAQSNVTIYGIADIGLQVAKSPNGNVARVTSGNQTGSRWGLRGTEELGGGLKAEFVLESGINVDTGVGGSALFDRRSTVNLTGGFGSVGLGRRDVPLYTLLTNAEPFGSGNSMGMNGILTGAARGYTRRVSNQIRYETPNLSGFRGDVLYGLGESNTTSGTQKSLNDVLSAGLTYNAGPFYAGYVYYGSKDPATSGTGPLAGVITGVTTHKIQAIAGSYDLTAVKFYGFYYTDKRNATAITPLPTDQRIASLAFSVPVGAAGSIAVQGSKVKDKVNRASGPADARQYDLAYLYTLSRRTLLYASYGNVSNKNYVASTGGFTAQGTGLYDTGASSTTANSVTAKSTAWVFGIKHQF